MNIYNYNLSNKELWEQFLEKFENIDFYFYPDFHDLYKLRYSKAQPNVWIFEEHDNIFLYPFNLTEIDLQINQGKKFFDISSTYGFVGPISTTNDPKFISAAWNEFDIWSNKNGIVLEFIRFNPLINNQKISHKNTVIEFNRYVGISDYRHGENYFKDKIPSKTKNMIKKASKNGFETKKICFKEIKNDFLKIYRETMKRNKANTFFDYDEKYFEKLCDFNQTQFYGIFHENNLVAGGIFFVTNGIASYHLGACKKEFLKFGLSNLYLYDASLDFIKNEVNFMNLGGGRTTSNQDGLFKFKRDNSTEKKKFFIGKRIINSEIYNFISSKFGEKKKNSNRLIFYR